MNPKPGLETDRDVLRRLILVWVSSGARLIPLRRPVDWQSRNAGFASNRFGVNTILRRAGLALASALKEFSRWRVACDDGVALVFRHAAATARENNPVAFGDGVGRGRETTIIEARDRAITLVQDKATSS